MMALAPCGPRRARRGPIPASRRARLARAKRFGVGGKVDGKSVAVEIAGRRVAVAVLCSEATTADSFRKAANAREPAIVSNTIVTASRSWTAVTIPCAIIRYDPSPTSTHTRRSGAAILTPSPPAYLRSPCTSSLYRGDSPSDSGPARACGDRPETSSRADDDVRRTERVLERADNLGLRHPPPPLGAFGPRAGGADTADFHPPVRARRGDGLGIRPDAVTRDQRQQLLEHGPRVAHQRGPAACFRRRAPRR